MGDPEEDALRSSLSDENRPAIGRAVKRILLLLAIALATAFGDEKHHPAKPLQMRDVPQASEKFDKIYRAVLRETFRVFPRTITITQHVEGRLFLARFGPKDLGVVMNMIAVELPAGDTPADNTEVEYYVSKTGETFSYTSVLGAKQTVPRYAGSAESAEMTKGQFLQRLKDGEAFLAREGTEEVRCAACGGWGRIADKGKRARKGDGKIDCPKCDKGKAVVDSSWSIRW